MNSYSFTNVYYRVEIDGSSFIALAAPRDGFIDNTNTFHHASDGGHPTTLDAALAKERANARWEEVMVQTQQIATPVGVTAIEKAGSPTSDDPPTAVAFTIVFDREDYVYTHNIENSPANVEILRGSAAIRRMVARALMVSKSTNRDVYSPVLIDGVPQGVMYFDIETGPLALTLADAEAAVAVTQIANV